LGFFFFCGGGGGGGGRTVEKISRHFVIQSEGKQNLIVTRSLSHASCTLQERAGLDTNINVAVLRDAVINVLILST